MWFVDTFLLHGQIRGLRNQVLDLAQLRSGQSVLDVGCGTGTLAISAAEQVGPSGRVAGIDPDPRQIGRARSKARRASLPLELGLGRIQRVPFADATFDIVFSTIMLHHLPVELKRRGLAEILRVLKPAGRLVAADLESTPPPALDHPSPAGVRPETEDVLELLNLSGFTDLHSTTADFPRSHHRWAGALFLTATKPS